MGEYSARPVQLASLVSPRPVYWRRLRRHAIEFMQARTLYIGARSIEMTTVQTEWRIAEPVAASFLPARGARYYARLAAAKEASCGASWAKQICRLLVCLYARALEPRFAPSPASYIEAPALALAAAAACALHRAAQLFATRAQAQRSARSQSNSQSQQRRRAASQAPLRFEMQFLAATQAAAAAAHAQQCSARQSV